MSDKLKAGYTAALPHIRSAQAAFDAVKNGWTGGRAGETWPPDELRECICVSSARHQANCPAGWTTDADEFDPGGHERATLDHPVSASPRSDGREFEAVAQWRQHEMQEIGAAISKRNWQELESAYNQLRDKMDRHLREASQ